MQKIRKAVFPVAGLGTRFLPATKASPKEMLSIVDKPLIQYAVEEAVQAGISEMIFVTGRNKRAIEDHFDKAYELEHVLNKQNKHALLRIVDNILPRHVSCAYIRQAESLGLGHAVLCARNLVGNEPFAVILADDLIQAEKPVLQQMVEVFERKHHTLIGVQHVPQEQVSAYGIVSAVGKQRRGALAIDAIVEKPSLAQAPSNLAVVGRYLFTPSIFQHLLNVQPGRGGEIQLTDAIASLLCEEAVSAWPFSGIRYDCGSKLGYLQATLAYGMAHPEVGTAFSHYLSELCATMHGK